MATPILNAKSGQNLSCEVLIAAAVGAHRGNQWFMATPSAEMETHRGITLLFKFNAWLGASG